jgi:serine/threonine protein phosphatase PrpC
MSRLQLFRQPLQVGSGRFAPTQPQANVSEFADPQSPAGPVVVTTTAVTDIGMRRSNNQDHYGVVLATTAAEMVNRGHLLLVADGMGAHAAGELASQLAVDWIPHHYRKSVDEPPPAALRHAFRETNAEIYRRGQANPEFRSMGTTASGLLLLPFGAVVGHVGDSRVYRLRGGHLQQLTFDHSLVWEMEACGHGEERLQLERIPKNVITRSLGPNPEVQVDLEGPFPLQVGDCFLLCSDGLTGQLDDSEIACLSDCLPLDLAAEVMRDLANLRGGPDNITLVLCRIERLDLQAPPAPSEATALPMRLVRSSAVWFYLGLAALCLLVSLVMALAGNGPLAMVTALLGTIPIGVAAWRWWMVEPPAGTDQPLGRGPYRRASAQATQPFLDRLAGTLQALREAAQENAWPVDLERIDQQQAAARQAEQTASLREAVVLYATTIAEVMRQLRSEQPGSISSVAIDP